jgi:hypothetical protein
MTLRKKAPRAKQRWITLGFSVTAAMLLVAGAVFATLAPSTFDAFDGNLVLNDDGLPGNEDAKDWENIGINCTSTPKVGCGLDLPTGQTDDSFGQGTKEDTAVPTIVNGSIPNNKSDLTRFYVANEKASGKDFLYLAWERVQEPNGTTNMDFEFNQRQCTPGLTIPDPDCSANGVTPIRSAGDVLIKYDLSQGGVNPTLGYHTWVTSGTPATVCEASNTVPCWGPVASLATNFEGTVNTAVVSDPINPAAPRDLSARTFGEAAINLTDSNILPGGGTSCSGFGSAYLKSRSSDAFTSAVKDFIAPIPVNISNCGNIIVAKVTDPSGSLTVFDFNPSWSTTDFTLTDAGPPVNSGGLLAGNYSVTELAETGWDLTSASCSTDGGAPVAYTNGGTIALGVGETITCTFNNRARGSIIVEKQTNPDGATGSFTFTGTAAGSISDDGQITVSDLVPGQYTSTEVDPTPAFDLTSISCDDANSSGSTSTRTATFNLEAGETVKCTFNNKQRGTVIVRKQTDPNAASGSFSFDTTGNLDAAEGAGVEFSLSDDGVKTYSDVVAGSYSVAESDPTPTFDLTGLICTPTGTGTSATTSTATRTASLTLGAGGTLDCTFTNKQRGTINIHKQDDLGNALQGAVFTLFTDVAPLDVAAPHGVEDVATSTTCTTNALGNCTMSNIVPGQYWVVETTGVGGYDLAADQNVILGAGGTVNLTFTDPRQHVVIVIVCHMGTNTLAPSDVTIGSDESTLTTTLSAPPAGMTEAQLCGLGGARYPNISTHVLNKLFQIDIGSDAH